MDKRCDHCEHVTVMNREMGEVKARLDVLLMMLKVVIGISGSVLALFVKAALGL